MSNKTVERNVNLKSSLMMTFENSADVLETNSMLTDDEATLYDRQIRLWGADAQLKLRQTRLLIINVNSLSIEVCKNLCLAGVAGITIMDNEKVKQSDVDHSLTLTISKENINEYKAECTCKMLQQLNPRVHMLADYQRTIEEIDINYLNSFDFVCIFNHFNYQQILYLNNLCHQTKNNDRHINFFCAATFGLYGYVFKDLGESYDYFSAISLGTETLIKGEGGHPSESQKNEQITKKNERKFITFEKALKTEWRPSKRREIYRSGLTTYTLLKALLAFFEKYQRVPELKTHDIDIPNLLSIIKHLDQTATTSKDIDSSMNDNELNEEMLTDILNDNNAVASIVGGAMSHDIVKALLRSMITPNPLSNTIITQLIHQPSSDSSTAILITTTISALATSSPARLCQYQS
ncbi:unnamed protein product [Didymodactylos carnosus]|uniref:SUMO-activating enzyme subunit 1 n=1 Tax=Didymodactylos carnosus TaxID=1234261 RepID=A0A813Y3E1_9BILA|nr:unnamed protein product [Didymodactylos carnosus]CAF0992102.1 unnamed protein product [Didymodactylos carnosus]CAF3664240.1 unnamed protein product [Didymodactylos carnosus]CAF3762103.1 unnamed protein product [Didymodactylos carnosus]